jgi:hypothetical protein
VRTRAVVIDGLLVVITLFVGASLLWAEPTEFGWFAYAGSASDASPRLFVMTARREFALVLAGVGLLILGTLLGFSVGRRSRSSSLD